MVFLPYPRSRLFALRDLFIIFQTNAYFIVQALGILTHQSLIIMNLCQKYLSTWALNCHEALSPPPAHSPVSLSLPWSPSPPGPPQSGAVGPNALSQQYSVQGPSLLTCPWRHKQHQPSHSNHPSPPRKHISGPSTRFLSCKQLSHYYNLPAFFWTNTVGPCWSRQGV